MSSTSNVLVLGVEHPRDAATIRSLATAMRRLKRLETRGLTGETRPASA